MLLVKCLISSLLILSLWANPVSLELGKNDNEIILSGKIDENWHIYWKNPGETGFPSSFETLIDGEKVKIEQEWSVPEIFFSNNKKSYGYAKNFQIKFKNLAGNEIKVIAKLLGCSKNICKPIKIEINGNIKNLKSLEMQNKFANKVYITKVGDLLYTNIDLKNKELVSELKSKFEIKDINLGILTTKDSTGSFLLLEELKEFHW